MSIAELLTWPDDIKAVADAANKRAKASQQAAENVQAINDISQWKGDAGDAARDAMKRSANRFDKSGLDALLVASQANSVQSEAANLATDIKTFLANADADPAVNVNTQTDQIDTPDTTHMDTDRAKKVLDKVADLKVQMTTLLGRGETLDADLARVLDVGTGGHTMDSKPGASSADADQARQDVTDVLAGTATPEELARVRAASTLSPDQIADRDAGRTVQLTRSQQLVLGQMQSQMNGMSIEDIHRAEQRLGDNKSIIGNSLQMMGSSQYSYAKTKAEVGANGSPDNLTTGGYNQLPKSVQEALNDHSPGYANVSLGPGQGTAPVTQSGDTLGNLDRLSDVIKDGDPGFQHGTDLDSKLLQRGADVLHYENQNGNSAHGPADSTIQNLFSAGGRDHIADHNMIVGDGGKPNDQFLGDLTHHTFNDGGTAAGSLMSWTGNSAHEGPGVSAEQARMAGETAHAYSQYVIDHHDDLTQLSAGDSGAKKTLGELSPGLVQGMATGLAPYAATIAGGDPAIFGDTPGFSKFDTDDAIVNGSMPQAKALFGVLDTDKTAAETINGAMYADSVAASHHYADGVQQGHGEVGDLDQAGRFRGLADAGLASANDANTNDHSKSEYQKAKDLYDMKQQAYGVGSKALALSGLSNPALDMALDSAKDTIIGPAPEPGQPVNTTVPNMSPGDGQQQLIDAFLSQGVMRPDQIPPDMLVNERYADPIHPLDHDVWRVKTLDEMRASDPGMSVDRYHTLLTQAIGPEQEKRAGNLETAYDNAVKATH